METRRQMIHLSGLLFVILAQFTDSITAVLYFFMIAATFLVYSEYVRRERKRIASLLENMEKRIRGFMTGFERTSTSRPFLGAFWFYAGCGIAFLLFPHAVASAACAMLAVGDALSTLLGSRLGRHRLVGSKTLVGSVAFFAGSLLVSLVFVNAWIALAGSVAATAAELLPDVRLFIKAKNRGMIDDNLIIPVIAGLVMALL